MTMTDPADPVVEALRKIAQHWQLMYGAPCTLSAELARDALPLAEATAARVREAEDVLRRIAGAPHICRMAEVLYGEDECPGHWAQAALDHPGTCNGCGAAWNPADHVYGQRACCPECDHPGKDEG